MDDALDRVLSPFIKNNVDILVLGCTHFPLIKDLIQKKVGKSVKVIDSGQAVAKRVQGILIEKKNLVTMHYPQRKFYTTGSTHDANTFLIDSQEWESRGVRRGI